MKLKIHAIGITFIIFVSVFLTSAGNTLANGENITETIEINVAILYEEPVGWGSGKCLFKAALDNYQWTVGNKHYMFVVSEIYDKDIIRGKLNTNNFDMLLVPGGGVGDGESWVKGFYRLPKARIWKNQISSFIKDGGGYAGYCGGAALMAEVYGKPKNFCERQYQTSSLGVSCVKIDLSDVSSSFFRPGKGVASYVWFPQGQTDHKNVEGFSSGLGGVPLDLIINNNHPIFDDFLSETERVKWIGGAPLVLPDDPDRDVEVISRFPEEEMSDNESTKIYEWKYTGSIRGLIRGLGEAFTLFKEKNEPLKNLPATAFFKASDWELTDNIVQTNFSDKPCMTAESYPNENKGRIVLCSPHPEYKVWWGGHIEEMEDTEDNCLVDGFHKWVDVTPFNETVEDELHHTWWMIRRQVAWASQKVPDNDLPPIYGPSQVSDIYPYEQSSVFTIEGNVKTANGITSTELFYRHSNDNESWGSWTSYEIDDDGSDGWSWEFNITNANNSGYYQLYSIRHVKYEGCTEIEIAPPGPDAIAKVVD